MCDYRAKAEFLNKNKFYIRCVHGANVHVPIEEDKHTKAKNHCKTKVFDMWRRLTEATAISKI